MVFRWWVVLLVFWPVVGSADSLPEEEEKFPEVITDRPDFTESAASVPDGFVQFEFGAEFANSQDRRDLVLPLVLARIGLFEGFELRVGVPNIEIGWPKGEASLTDVGGLELGFKYVTGLGDAVSIGVLPYLTIPVKGEQFESLGVGLGAKLVWSVDVTDWIGVGGNFGLLAEGLGGISAAKDREYQASLAMGFGVTDVVGLFIEVFTEIAESEAKKAPVHVDGGVTWLVTRALQLDLYAGINTRKAEEVFVGLGGAYLW